MKSALIAGSGGQGVLFLGKLLAHGAMLSGLNVTWFPSYGAEMRGGTANCTVVVSEDIIGSPIVGSPDVVVVLNEASKVRFEGRPRQGGVMLLDSSRLTSPVSRDDIRTVSVPASDVAASLGQPGSANMVMLGAMLGEFEAVGFENVLAALKSLTPPRKKAFLDANIKALSEGRAYNGG